VHTGHSFPVGDVVDVSIPLNNRKLKIKAKVQYNQKSVGMGLKFVELSDTHKEIIKKYIELRSVQGSRIGNNIKRILLIEENETTRRIYSSKLMLEGFQVNDVHDGIEAVKFLNSETPDLIVLDLHMEKCDGFKVLAMLRESPKWDKTHVIIFSSKGTQDVIDKVVSAGADEFLFKAMTSPTTLADAAKNLAGRKSG
jgi:CheY-like chemotaxis protein